MNLMGLKMGRRLGSAVQVMMIASLLVKAAAGEMTSFAYEPRRSVDEGSGWFTNVLMMVVLILALVGLDTLRSAAKSLLTWKRETRSVGVQTELTNPPMEMGRERAMPAGPTSMSSGGLEFCLATLTVEQLKGLCRDKNLPVGGVKRDLIARLAQRGDI